MVHLVFSNIEQLYSFADKINNDEANFADKYYQLGADIDLGTAWDDNGKILEGKVWTFIEKEFKGVFDGKGHSISGLYLREDERYEPMGFFLYNNGIIKNLKIAEAYFQPFFAQAGILAANNSGSIINCQNYGHVVLTGGDMFSPITGAFVGSNKGTIEGCDNYGSIRSSAKY